MALKIDNHLTAVRLLPKIHQLFELSAAKILSLQKTWNPGRGTPVFTCEGRYTSRGWTEWTQGFQFGSALLQYDATGEAQFLELGRRETIRCMAPHLSHFGVHDHGFNNISTYGTLWRLINEGELPFDPQEKEYYELALKVSGAVQAARWTAVGPNRGFVYSFNGPHSLFIDTMRSLRSLAVAHQLGHVLMGEQDARVSLLERLLQHALLTAEYAVYYGEGRDAYDVAGRVAQESLFNVVNGAYRCPSTQQGYSPFSTWTRGLAWGLLGFAEQLEFLAETPRQRLGAGMRAATVREQMLRAATVTADYYLANSAACGVPLWDTAAPNGYRLTHALNRPADPYNPWEPVDSSAATIAGQGLLRLGNYLRAAGHRGEGVRYRQAAFTIAHTLFSEPYLSTQPKHQGLILHSIYHRPNRWDYTQKGQKVPNGESSMWGDYHARELALLISREARGEPYVTFFRSQRNH